MIPNPISLTNHSTIVSLFIFYCFNFSPFNYNIISIYKNSHLKTSIARFVSYISFSLMRYIVRICRSFLLLLFLASSGLFPSKVLILDVLDGIVQSNKLFFLYNISSTFLCFYNSLFFSFRSRSIFFSSSSWYLFLKIYSSLLVFYICSVS